MHNHSNLYLSVGSAIGSAFSYLVWFATNYHIMGLLGFVCICISIIAGYLTIKEKQMSINDMKQGGIEEVKAMHMIRKILRRKSGGRQ